MRRMIDGMTSTGPCPTCGGSGENPAAESDLDQLLLGACPTCDGAICFDGYELRGYVPNQPDHDCRERDRAWVLHCSDVENDPGTSPVAVYLDPSSILAEPGWQPRDESFMRHAARWVEWLTPVEIRNAPEPHER